ncbi:MAG TPA: 2-amino-4-hydroxy-6-hydroxymethyldihydropteridine diphosphokinase [Gammaproteobacteria bacterium]|jgi:2-amino-4-hydroxy-6-hydroxymethyldihydropteridine diphosphokinase
MPEVFVGCGSNIEPERHLLWALGELERRFGPIRRSSVYRSAAFGFDGPDFLNMVIGFSTDEPVDVVEGFLSELESECGREVGSRSGSRTLDLDLLMFGQRVDPKWRLPRDDVLRYSFVRIPLADLAPGLRHPVTGIAMQDAGDRTTLDDANLTAIGALDAA